VSILMSPCSIAGIDVRNRFVRSATWERKAADNGEVTDALVEVYEQLAAGGVGLIITSFTFVDPRGHSAAGMIGVDDDALIPGLTRIPAAVHKRGGAVVLQMVHGGSQFSREPDGPVEGPSAVVDRLTGTMPREMSGQDIARVVEAFGRAAGRAKACGFDGVQFHAAHGFLLSAFLSPYSNRRADRYGGSIENRARILFEAYDAVRAEVGPTFPVMAKINVCDFDNVGLSEQESLWVCGQLVERGLDVIELSGGVAAAGVYGPVRTGIDSPEKEAYFREEARRFSPHITCPVILVGGIRSLAVAEQLYEENVAQFFSMARPFITEPDLVNRWAQGDTTRARCTSCNRCFVAAKAGSPLHCTAFD